MAMSACATMSNNTHPTLLNTVEAERHEEMKLLASELLVSPTSISIEGLRVEPKLTKQ